MGEITKESILEYCEEAKRVLDGLMEKSMEMHDFRALDHFEKHWMTYEFEIPQMLREIERGETNDINT